MAMFVQGLGYGLMAFGWLVSFGACVIGLCSLCMFLSMVGDKFNDVAEEMEERDDDDV